jgi:hypothetical protein
MAEEKGWIRRHTLAATITALIAIGVPALLIWVSPGFRNVVTSAPGWLAAPVRVARWHYWLLALISGGYILITLLALAAAFTFSSSSPPPKE